MTAALWLVPAEEFTGAGRPHFRADGLSFDIDKAWYEFDMVFRDMPPPLNLAIEGDIPPEERKPEDIDATSLSFVSPRVVAEIVQCLDRIEPDEMVGLLEKRFPRLDVWDLEYFADFYETLRKAYRTAAAAGAGLGVLLC